MPSPSTVLSVAAEGMTLAAVPGLPEWLSPESLVKAGLVALLVVVFVETGLLVGFFLPGDSLLFTAGLLVAQDEVLDHLSGGHNGEV